MRAWARLPRALRNGPLGLLPKSRGFDVLDPEMALRNPSHVALPARGGGQPDRAGRAGPARAARGDGARPWSCTAPVTAPSPWRTRSSWPAPSGPPRSSGCGCQKSGHLIGIDVERRTVIEAVVRFFNKHGGAASPGPHAGRSLGRCLGVKVVAAIDQGTTGTTVLLLDAAGEIVGRGYRELPQHFPGPRLGGARSRGLGAHHPGGAGPGPRRGRRPGGGGGRPDQPARDHGVVGSSERAAGRSGHRLAGSPHPGTLRGAAAGRARAGGCRPGPACCSIRISRPPRSPGCSSSVPGLRARAERGEIAFGTVDSYLTFRLSGGRSHITDLSNASRTLLFDLHTLDWSDELLSLFGVPRALLPTAGALLRASWPRCRGCPGWPTARPCVAWPAISKRRSTVRAVSPRATPSAPTARAPSC